MDCCQNLILYHLILTPVIVVMFGVWLYAYFTCGVCRSKARMDGKTVIITGANSGIGKTTALDLAKRGARVILACRNLNKAHAARDDIIKATDNQNVVVKQLDISLMSSVRKFAEEINKSERRLDVLIHNAGTASGGRKVTPEGLQVIWATNYFGPFLLTHLLIDLMKKTRKGRIIVLSSNLHYFGSLSLKKPDHTEEVPTVKLYCRSKLANVFFTNELARRLEGTGITANALHPGMTYTPIWENNPWLIQACISLFSVYLKNIEQGSQTTIYLAVSEDVEEITGKYFQDCKEYAPAKKSKDVEFGKRYWELSKEIVKLKPTDPHI